MARKAALNPMNDPEVQIEVKNFEALLVDPDMIDDELEPDLRVRATQIYNAAKKYYPTADAQKVASGWFE